MNKENLLENRLNVAAIIIGLATALIGGAVLVAWGFGNPYIFSLGKNYIPMAGETALSFLLFGIALALERKSRINKALRYYVIVSATIIIVIAIFAIIDFATNYVYNINEILWGKSELIHGILTGKMSFFTASCFIFESVALILLKGKNAKISVVFSSANLVLGYLFVIRYFYGIPYIYQTKIIPMALPTSIVFIVSAFGLYILAGKNLFPLKYFIGNSARARLMRYFIPIVILINLLQDISQLPFISNTNSTYAITEGMFNILLLIVSGFVVSLITRSIGNTIDKYIDELKLAKETIRKSEENLSITLDSIGDGVIATDENGLITGINPVAEKLCGWNANEAKEMPLTEVFYIINAETREPVTNPVKKVIETGGIVGLANHTILISKDGTEYQIADSAAPIKNSEGKIIGVVITFSDITEKYATEKVLREIESRYNSFVNSHSDLIFIKDENMRYIMVNDANCKYFGKSREEILFKTDFELMDGPAALACKKSDAMAISSNQHVVNIESIGDKIYETTKFPLLLTNNQFGIGGIIRDITEQKQAEEKLNERTEELIKTVSELKASRLTAINIMEDAIEAKNKLIVSETRYRRLFEAAKDGILILDAETGMIMDVNPFLVEMLGYSFEQFIGKAVWELGPFSDIIPNKSNFFELQQKGYVRYEDFPLESVNGIRKDVEFVSNVYFVDHTKVIQCNIRDITERKRAEKELRKSEQELRILAESMPQIVWITTPDGANVYFNQQWVDYTGLTLEESYGDGWNKPFHPDDQQRAWDAWQNATKNNAEYSIECRLRRADGAYYWWLVRGVPYIDETGEIIKWYGTCTYIDKLKRSEEALKESEEKFRNLFESSVLGIYRSNPAGKILLANKALIRMLGYDSFDDLSQRDINVNGYLDSTKRKEFLELIEKEGELRGFEAVWKRKDGTPVFIRENAKVVSDNNGNVLYYEGTVENITERKYVEEALEESEEKFRNIFMLHTAVKILIDPETGNIIDANESAANYYGWSVDEFKQMKIHQINTLPPEEIKKRMDQVVAEKRTHFEFQHRKKDGSIRDVDVFSSKINISGKDYLHSIIHDISDRKQTEARKELFSKILTILNRQNEWQYLIKDILKEIKAFTGFDAVGIRLKEWEDYPYLEQSGFSDDFIEKENYLCGLDADNREILECNCGVVLSGRTDPEKPYFTKGGSFWTNHSVDLLDLNPAEDLRINPRDLCIKYGYMSVALVPVKAGKEIVGLLQLNDRKPEAFTLDFVQFFEEIANSIGISYNRMKSEEKIKEAEENYRKLFENALEGIYQTTLDGKFIDVNPALCKILGYSSKEELISSISNIAQQLYMIPENREKSKLSVLESGGILGNEEQLRKKDGTLIWISESITPVFDINGRLEHFEGTITDITETKKYREQLIRAKEKAEESEFFLTESQKVGNVGSYYTDFVNGKWTSSPALDKIFGIGKNYKRTVEGWLIIVHPDDREMMNNYLLEEVIAKRRKFEKEYRIKRIDNGETRWVFGIGETEFDAGNNILSMIGTIQDITESKLAQEELIRAKEKAEENDKLKSAFLANMSHEIRTPLTGIVGFTELITEPGISDEERKEFIKLIDSSSKRLIELINNLLDISKIQTGQFNIKKRNVVLQEPIFDCYGFFCKLAQEKNIDFSYVLPEGSNDLVVFTDENRLCQILFNLIGNAIKFTRKGFIEFGYVLRDDFVEYFVKDTGIGIKKENFTRIFEMFTQIDFTFAREFEGAGLGLSICKGIVKLLGGDIWVESKQGVGSTFYFTIPYDNLNKKVEINNEVLTEPDNEKPILNNSAFKIILVVEDDDINYLYTEKILERSGYQTLRAIRGEEAIEIVRTKDKINLILMDIKLAGMNGYEATKIIKSIKPEIPIIASTAFAMEGDREKAIDAGCDDYIPKPFSQLGLKEIIEKWI